MFFHEEKETEKFFDAAVDYFKRTPADGVKIGKVHKIFSNGSDAIKLVADSKDLSPYFLTKHLK